MNGDRILALIARNHDLLRVAAETRRQTLRLAVETHRRRRQARRALAGARKAAEQAKEVAERAKLIMVRRAVLRAAAAGGWEAAQPKREVIRAIMFNDLKVSAQSSVSAGRGVR